jgi:hypothetical protein
MLVRLATLVEAGEDVEGVGVEAVGEEGLSSLDEELIAGGGVGEEGHGGVELEVVGGAEDLADGEGPGEEEELCALGEPGAEDGVGEVGGGFGERGDGVGAGGGARAEALDLREDEPDPVAGLALPAELAEDFGVDGGLGGEEAVEVVGVGHGWSLRGSLIVDAVEGFWVARRRAIQSLRLRLRSGLRQQGARFARAGFCTG